jgi:hypothetical protein
MYFWKLFDKALLGFIQVCLGEGESPFKYGALSRSSSIDPLYMKYDEKCTCKLRNVGNRRYK